MKPPLELTSVPAWSTTCAQPAADLTGTTWTVVAFGPDDEDVVDTWLTQIAAHRPGAAAPQIYRVDDQVAATAAVTDALEQAVVGWRLMVAGPADAVLRMRAHALQLGVCDDEITVATTAVSHRVVHCVHCGTSTRADIELEGTVACHGCERNLLVHYHVSRLMGSHLGYMVDAEEQPEAQAS